jgi:elongation factor P
MYSVSDLKKGLKIELDGKPYEITEYNFLKPGKGHALHNCKLKNMIDGSTLTKTYRDNDKFDRPSLEERTLEYSYAEGDHYIFMDENYEQVLMSADSLGQSRFFLVENDEVKVLLHNDSPIGVTLPTFIEKAVVATEPGARGNTATNVLKPATIEGGYEVKVPIFVNQGDVIKIDTRTGDYAGRSQS